MDASRRNGGGTTVSVSHLTYVVPLGTGCCAGGASLKKVLLHDVSMIARPGEVLAIVGPSGSGKTTLLNAIAHRAMPRNIVSGEIFFNGATPARADLEREFNYVMTHDRLMPYLTVCETLKYAAALKLSSWPAAEREARVEALIEQFQLSKCRDTLIGGEWRKGISTGELKRVAIAVELLDDPAVLILDEPTSGLDSSLSTRVLQLLLAEARRGRTVICTVHQPPSEVFCLLDRFLLLSAGRVVYQGPVDRAPDYFARLGYTPSKGWAPCDFYLELASDDLSITDDLKSGGEGGADGILQHRLGSNQRAALFAAWEKSAEARLVEDDIEAAGCDAPAAAASTTDPSIEAIVGKQAVVEQSAPPPEKLARGRRKKLAHGCAQWWTEFSTLTKRSFVNTLRNPLAVLVAILVQAMQGLILGGIFYHTSTVSTGGKPEPMLGVSFWENTFVQALIWGIDGMGTHPLMTMWERGVDGHGSYVLGGHNKTAEDAKSAAFFLMHDVVECLYTEYNLASEYPEIPELDKVPQATSWDDWTPKRLYQNVMMAYQFFDKQWGTDSRSGIDLSFVDECYAELDMSLDQPVVASNFFTCFMDRGKALFDPLLKCINLPPLPTLQPLPILKNAPSQQSTAFVRRELLAAPSAAQPQKVPAMPPPPAARRQLVAFGTDEKTKEAVEEFIGPELMAVINSLQDLIHRVTECTEDLCGHLMTWRQFFADFANGTLDTIASMLSLSGCLFFVATVLGFASYDALLTFPQERVLYNRESANGMYSSSAYYLAKNVADFPLQLVPCTLLVLVFYFLVGFDLTAVQVFTYLLITTLICYTAYGFAYFVSALSPRMELALLIAPLTLVIWLVLAGFFLRDGDIPAWIDWFKYLSLYRWAFFALCANQFPVGRYFGTFPNRVNLALSGVTTTSLWSNIAILFGLGCLWRLCGFFALSKTNRRIGLEA